MFPYNLIFTTKFNEILDFNYDNFIGLFEFVRWRPHNTYPDYHA
jgi:hypothetical protein